MRKYHLTVKLIADHYNIPVELIYGKNARLEVARVRHMIAFILRDVYELSLKSIGEILGGRDHSTISNSLDNFNPITNPQLCKDVEELKHRVMEMEIPTGKWIANRIKPLENIEFSYGENQDLCGIYRMSMV